jgi:hypothetical protein
LPREARLLKKVVATSSNRCAQDIQPRLRAGHFVAEVNDERN